MTYAEKLKDPRWQKRRLEIFQRDNFRCVKCGATDRTLHVNHKQYSGEPWEATDEMLETLCESCHASDTEERALGKRFLAAFQKAGLSTEYLRSFVEALEASAVDSVLDNIDLYQSLEVVVRHSDVMSLVRDLDIFEFAALEFNAEPKESDRNRVAARIDEIFNRVATDRAAGKPWRGRA